MEQTSSLRKRTKSLAANSLSEALADASPRTTGSQLPSPLSSIDETMTAVLGELGVREPPSPRSHPRRRRSSTKSVRRAPTSSKLDHDGGSTSDTQWIDIPLAVALIPPLGSFLTGGDFLRDFLLFILLFFYLHQVGTTALVKE